MSDVQNSWTRICGFAEIMFNRWEGEVSKLREQKYPVSFQQMVGLPELSERVDRFFAVFGSVATTNDFPALVKAGTDVAQATETLMDWNEALLKKYPEFTLVIKHMSELTEILRKVVVQFLRAEAALSESMATKLPRITPAGMQAHDMDVFSAYLVLEEFWATYKNDYWKNGSAAERASFDKPLTETVELTLGFTEDHLRGHDVDVRELVTLGQEISLTLDRFRQRGEDINNFPHSCFGKALNVVEALRDQITAGEKPSEVLKQSLGIGIKGAFPRPSGAPKFNRSLSTPYDPKLS